MELPKRRLHFSLDIEADSLEEIIIRLANVGHKIDQAMQTIDPLPISLISGGWASSLTLHIDQNPDGVDGDIYREALHRWSRERRSS